jgi:hypothetical protein
MMQLVGSILHSGMVKSERDGVGIEGGDDARIQKGEGVTGHLLGWHENKYIS